MSLIEPLLPKKDLEDQKFEKYSIDPLANLEKSIQNLPFDYESFEFDAIKDIDSSDKSFLEKVQFFSSGKNKRFIKCSATFANKIAIGRADGSLKIYNLDSKEEISLKGHTNAVNCLQVCYNQDFLVSGSSDKTIIIWNLSSYTRERAFKGEEEVIGLLVNRFYNLFSISLNENFVRKWNFYNENEASINFNGHEGNITCMNTFQLDNALVTGSKDKTLRTWTIKNNKELNIYKGHKGTITEIAIQKNSKCMISGSDSSEIIIWEIDNKVIVAKIDTMFDARSLDFINNSECIWAIDNQWDESCEIQAYNITSKEYKKPTQFAWTRAYSKETNLFYYNKGSSGPIHVLDTNKFCELPLIDKFESEIDKILICGHRDKYLASIMENGKIKIHKINKVKTQEDVSLLFKETNIKLTQDGKYLLRFSNESLKIWSFAEKKDVFTIDKNVNVLNLQISYDNVYFVFIEQKSNAIYVFSFQDMKEVAKFELENVSKDFVFQLVKTVVLLLQKYLMEK